MEEQEKKITMERRRSLRIQIRPNYQELNDSFNYQLEIADEKPKKSKKLNTVEDYYLDKTVKRLPASFETIFEEPVLNESNEVVYMSKKKFKRTLTLPKYLNKVPPGKTKIRKKKARQVLGKKHIKKIPQEYFKEVLEQIEKPDDGSGMIDSNED